MKTKITHNQLTQILKNPARLPPEVAEAVSCLIDADRETGDFLLGFASCLEVMSTPLIQDELSVDVKIFIIAMIQECAVSIRNRSN